MVEVEAHGALTVLGKTGTISGVPVVAFTLGAFLVRSAEARARDVIEVFISRTEVLRVLGALAPAIRIVPQREGGFTCAVFRQTAATALFAVPVEFGTTVHG